jgi:hypothetical protein
MPPTKKEIEAAVAEKNAATIAFARASMKYSKGGQEMDAARERLRLARDAERAMMRDLIQFAN